MNIPERLILGLLIVLLAGCTEKQEAEPRMERKQLFDSGWKFQLGDFPEAPTADFNDSSWRSLDLPHDWSIEGSVDKKNPTGNDGGYFPAGEGWYRKTFTVPSEWKDKEVSVYFEGVYTNSEVFINGTSLGMRPYGYSSFACKLTPYLEFGKENLMAVHVDNSMQNNSRWYTGSGIYRHVWLLVTDQVHIKHWGIGISTPEISPKEAFVEIKTTLVNSTNTKQNLKLLTNILDPKGAKLKSDSKPVSLAPGAETEVIQNIRVQGPAMWTPDSPDLYKANVQVIRDKVVIDQTEQTFGIRSIEFSSEKGFLLNGKPFLLNGGCVHHDNGILGAAAYDRAEERRVELLKSAGFNAMRTSHNPPSEAFLNACDRLGLLVMDEAFDGWKENKKPYDYANHFEEWAERDLQDMVLRDRNHPSIIMWSIGNEVLERKSPEAVEITKMLRDAIRQIDTTRPVTSAMTTWDEEWEIFDPMMAAHDVCGYNYQLSRAPSDHERVPSRIIVNTESYPANAFNIWKLVSEKSYIIGDFVWTAIDYLGEAGIGAYYYPGEDADEHWQSDRFPWHGAYCGDIDLTGWRKPISHYRSMLYDGPEKLYLAVREPNPGNGTIALTAWSVWPTHESWTWPGYEGKDIQVEVCSKYPRVRLYLNDSLIGEKATGKDEQFKALFTLPYTPGELKAAGMENGEVQETTILQTAGVAAAIKLTADRREIRANGQDLSFITLEITDQDGKLVPYADNVLEFEIAGPGVIAGLGNANLKDSESYVGTTCRAWQGRALMVIKSTKSTGQVVVNIKSEGLKDARISIRSNY
ncbi:MAG: DUF4982 domain-containing protein [Bacteroidales bacterium]|nr:DUF4982 domain-containing protein [Bacteroidales bacterium]